MIEEINNLETGSHKASTKTWNWSDGSKPSMPEIVLFMASTVVGGTSFWIMLTSNGSISCIKDERIDFWKYENKTRQQKNFTLKTDQHSSRT